MRQLRTFESVGALGGQPPRATRSVSASGHRFAPAVPPHPGRYVPISWGLWCVGSGRHQDLMMVFRR
jgi:hypothetical protein